MTKMKKIVWTGVMLLCSVCLKAQTTYYDGEPISLEKCRQMAIRQSKELDQARITEEMAGYDRKIAMANYFPKISATGAYLYNNRDVKLISDEQSERLRNAGTTLDNDIWDAMSTRVDKMESERMKEIGHSLLDMFRNSPDRIDIATPINAIGEEIDASLHPDLHNIWAGAVTVEQPIFVGGKIMYSNQMAALAQQLAKSQYDMKEADILLDVDQAYWQIISIS
jgi:outer membrane protein TolC